MNSAAAAPRAPDPGLVRVTHVVYGLHAVSLVIGAFGAASLVGAFLFGWPSIVAVIINYARRSEAAGSYLESHFRWQIRTFWFALLWALIVAAGSLVLAVVLIGFATWAIGLAALGLWAIYRIARGWLALRDGRSLPV